MNHPQGSSNPTVPTEDVEAPLLMPHVGGEGSHHPTYGTHHANGTATTKTSPPTLPVLSPDNNRISKQLGTFLRRIYSTHEFPIHVIVSIGLAKLYPRLGAELLQPKITATWIAVVIIFLISGLGLHTSDFGNVILQKTWFNVFVQAYNFGFVSAVVYGVSKALLAAHILPEELTNGMIICSCLPMAVNATIVLTAAAHGSEAAAIFHSTFGNIVGIFLSPLLILLYIPEASGEAELSVVFLDLFYRVLVPLIVGQVLRHFSTSLQTIYTKYKRYFKKTQEGCLVFIVYTVFCRTFYGGEFTTSVHETLLMIFFQLILMVSLQAIMWHLLRLLFGDEPELRIMGFFGCISKTVSLGVPLIDSIYGSDPNVGLYTLPLLIWFPMQLVVGSFYVPHLLVFLASERERLDKVSMEMSSERNST